jgi:hypothetical protein
MSLGERGRVSPRLAVGRSRRDAATRQDLIRRPPGSATFPRETPLQKKPDESGFHFLTSDFACNAESAWTAPATGGTMSH